MPSPYAKPSQQLFWDLVNRSNPQLKIPLSDDNCVIYGYPVAVTSNAASGFRNTRIRLYAKQGMGYKGELYLYYNRLSLSAFFTGITPSITNYTANSPQLVMNVFNALYGLNLGYSGRYSSGTQPAWSLGMVIPDITPYNGNYSTGNYASDNAMLFSIVPESLCWVPSTQLTINRVRGNPSYDTLITKPEITTMRKVPVTPNGKYNVPLLTWGIDFTDYQTTVMNFYNASTNRSNQLNLAAMLKDVTGLPFEWGNSATVPAGALDLNGFTAQYYGQAIGSKAHYNSDDFNRCIVLFRDSTSPPLGSGWTTEAWQVMMADQDDVNNLTFRYGVFMHLNV